MSTLGQIKLVSSVLRKVWEPQVNVKRNRWWKEQRKTPLVRRFGYEDDIIHKGLLPRIKDAKRFKSLPIYTPKDSWNEKKALFGQNDYIDILGTSFNPIQKNEKCSNGWKFIHASHFVGNGRLNPVQVGYDVPAWLRGFRGNEFETLLRKQALWSVGTFPEERPQKWEKIKSRIDWLWYHLNYRRKVKWKWFNFK